MHIQWSVENPLVGTWRSHLLWRSKAWARTFLLGNKWTTFTPRMWGWAIHMGLPSYSLRKVIEPQGRHFQDIFLPDPWRMMFLRSSYPRIFRNEAHSIKVQLSWYIFTLRRFPSCRLVPTGLLGELLALMERVIRGGALCSNMNTTVFQEFWSEFWADLGGKSILRLYTVYTHSAHAVVPEISLNTHILLRNRGWVLMKAKHVRDHLSSIFLGARAKKGLRRNLMTLETRPLN